MFFRRKGWLRNEYDQKLIEQLELLKKDWLYQKSMLEKSVDPSQDAILQTKLAEVKYFYLFKEAKQRRVSLRR
ncbi:YaaL family protein [Peribacillus psychrosaccharolyticus]|uniref:YaaL family protein n=1 Tax=Peribacillus psychrosaccharolyticus TaxID=1407 RepID=A0A974NJ24_PERPY|nr:YaaL family protein [Peribacillus psychrosaccharolyticus]MEC2058096.1 YaaL family protein [Peribacillus psychrosaccharolyticus]MED3746364.1 YaaL family protein [Peribacillus psychrosaccharolyticus]QQS98850.1 YaaL family protein [Peribacillus psychrosaccharolyticus]